MLTVLNIVCLLMMMMSHYGLLHLSTFYNVGADDDVDYEEDGYEDYDVDDDYLYALNMHLCHLLVLHMGVVGCDEGIVYLTSPGCPNDIGLLAYSWASCWQGLLSL